MSDTNAVAGDAADAGPGPSPRFLLNVVTGIVGIPLTWSFLCGMYDIKEYDPVYFLAKSFGYQNQIFWVGMAISAVLVFVDVILAKSDEDFKDDLYDIMKDVGEHVKSGMAVEAAVQKATSWKKSAPAEAFKRALDLSQNIPFDAALDKVASETGQRSLRESAGLMAMAVATGGDVGPSLRWVGGHFSQMRQNEKHFTTKIESGLMLMRFVGLLAAPFLYYHLQRAMDANAGEVAPMDPMTVAFFVYGAIGMGSLDGIVYDRWARVPAKLPLFIGLIRLGLGFW